MSASLHTTAQKQNRWWAPTSWLTTRKWQARALASYAFEEVRAHFGRALGALEGHPPDARRAAILFGLGRAEMWSLPYPETQRGWDRVARAFDLYVELGDERSAVVHSWFRL